MKIINKKIINNNNKNNNKYLVLIFSDSSNKPSKNFKPQGYGGFCHNRRGYLKPLPLIAKLLNRIAVYPPPWISLESGHNNNLINHNLIWDDFINTEKINNLEINPPFSFSDNGDIITNKSIKYYPSNTNLNILQNDKESEIIALVNFNDSNSKLFIYSFLVPNTKNIAILIKYLILFEKMTNDLTAKYLKNYAKDTISKLNLSNYIFLHIRRGDLLRKYINVTNPDYIKIFLNNRFKSNNMIFICTNEKELDYKINLKNKLNNYKIIFEDAIYNFIPKKIKENNYLIYLILDEIARNSRFNIGTGDYVRLGFKYNYRLTDNKIRLRNKIRKF